MSLYRGPSGGVSGGGGGGMQSSAGVDWTGSMSAGYDANTLMQMQMQMAGGGDLSAAYGQSQMGMDMQSLSMGADGAIYGSNAAVYDAGNESNASIHLYLHCEYYRHHSFTSCRRSFRFPS